MRGRHDKSTAGQQFGGMDVGRLGMEDHPVADPVEQCEEGIFRKKLALLPGGGMLRMHFFPPGRSVGRSLISG